MSNAVRELRPGQPPVQQQAERLQKTAHQPPFRVWRHCPSSGCSGRYGVGQKHGASTLADTVHATTHAAYAPRVRRARTAPGTPPDSRPAGGGGVKVRGPCVPPQSPCRRRRPRPQTSELDPPVLGLGGRQQTSLGVELQAGDVGVARRRLQRHPLRDRQRAVGLVDVVGADPRVEAPVQAHARDGAGLRAGERDGRGGAHAPAGEEALGGRLRARGPWVARGGRDQNTERGVRHRCPVLGEGGQASVKVGCWGSATSARCNAFWMGCLCLVYLPGPGGGGASVWEELGWGGADHLDMHTHTHTHTHTHYTRETNEATTKKPSEDDPSSTDPFGLTRFVSDQCCALFVTPVRLAFLRVNFFSKSI